MSLAPQVWVLTAGSDTRYDDHQLATRPLVAACLIAAGLLSTVPWQTLGTIYIGELLLALVAFFGVVSGAALQPGKRLDALLLVLLLLAYLATDLLVANSTENLLRGMARAGFLLVNFLALITLCGDSPARLALFVFSYAAADLARGVLQPQYATFEDVWKFQVGIPLSLVVLTAVDSFGGSRLLAVRFALAAITTAHLVLNYRSAALVCLLMLVVTYLHQASGARSRTIQRVLALTSILALLLVFWGFYRMATDRFNQRNTGSNAARVAGLIVACEMIQESPIIGYGSWVYGSEVVSRVSQRFTSMTGAEYYARNSIYAAAHSQVLQAWYEAGALTVPFFILYLIRHYSCLSQWLRSSNPDWYRQALLLLLLLDVWHFFLSPFAGPQRVTMAAGLAAALAFNQRYQANRLVAWSQGNGVFAGRAGQ